MALTALLVCLSAGVASASQTKQAADIERISPEKAYQKLKSGEALMVCAYEDDKCKKLLMQGALLKSELEARLPTLSKDQEMIFYCA